MTTARDVTEMLRKHYLPPNRPPAGIFAAEIGSPCETRRADLIWLPTTISGGASRKRTELVGHEIKVSRADVLVELADQTKADPWLRYCTRWWLTVSDPHLVDGLDIPAAWGIMAPPSGRRTRSMTVIRPAPQLHPVNQAPGLARLVSWQFWRNSNSESDLQQRLDHAERELTRARDAARTGETMRLDPAAKRVATVLALIKDRLNGSHMWAVDVTDEQIADTIVDLAATHAAVAELRRKIGDAAASLDRITQPLRPAHGQLAKLLADTNLAGTR